MQSPAVPWSGSVIDDAPSYAYFSALQSIVTWPPASRWKSIVDPSLTLTLTLIVSPSTDLEPEYAPEGVVESVGAPREARENIVKRSAKRRGRGEIMKEIREYTMGWGSGEMLRNYWAL